MNAPEPEPEQQLQEIDQTLPQEPTAMGAEAPAPAAGRGPLSVFRHRNYALFFSGQVISLTGTWLQQVALGWLVLTLTNSALLLGIVSSISALPVLVFSLPAGLVADRFNKRNLLVVTQTSAMILAFALAVLTYAHTATVFYIILIGFLLGVVNAFDAPTRQAFVVEMVGREDLTTAIAMNSAMFNGARIVGPAVAGAVVAVVGTAGAFLLNGISFIAVIIGLLLMTIGPTTRAVQSSALQGLSEGLRFVRGNSLVTALLLLTAIVSIFSMPYAVLMPIFARDVLRIGAAGLGYLMAATGVGALIGALLLSTLGDLPRKGRLLITGNLTFCTTLILFSLSRSVPLSLLLLIGAGWGMMTNMALTNTLIQTSVPDELRGRVMSVYTLMFMGMAPIGSLLAGALAHVMSASSAVRIGAVVCALTAIVLAPRIVRSGPSE